MKFPTLLSFPVLALAALFLAPVAGSAQSVLGTAGNFVLLGGTTVSVAGAGPDTFSNGNVGANSVTGFPPATVVNGTVLGSGSVLNQALLDLGTARNDLTSLSAGAPAANNRTGQDMSGQILVPGVYTYNVAAAMSVNGVLTLNAQGLNNVVWVFNVGTSLTTGANDQVVFTNLGSNNGSDDGVFWNVGSGITIGATNVVVGNYLSGTSITFGTTIAGTGSAAGSALAAAAVSFNGTSSMNALGGPGGGNLAGGLAPNGVSATTSGYVLLSSAGTYSGGTVTLTPGTLFNTLGVTVNGNSANGTGPSTLTVFGTTASLTGTNTYTGGTIVDGGTLITGSANLPTNGAVTLTNSNGTAVVSGLVFNQTANGTFGGAISGNGSVTLQNTGALTLSGVNTYTGGTTISGGTLFITSAVSLPGNITDNAALNFDQAAISTFSGIISGSGTVTKQDVGTVNLTGANTYTGVTTVSQGILNLQNNAALGSPASSTTVASGATLQLQGNITPAEPLNLLGAGVGGIGALDSVSGTNTVAGAVTLNGAATIDADAGTLTVSGAVGGATQNLTVGGAGNVALTGGVATTTGSLTKNGGGTLNLLGTASTFTGGTTVNAGTVALGAANLLAGAGSLTVNGGAFNLGAFSNTLASVTLSSGTISGTGTLTVSSAVSLQAGTAAAILAGAGTVTKTGAGTVTLSAANTYTGGTTVSAGTLAISGGGLLGGTAGTLAVNGGTLDLGATTQTVGAVTLGGGTLNNGTLTGTSFTSTGGTVGAILAGTGSAFTNTSGTTTLNGVDTYTGVTTVNGGTVVMGNASALGTGAAVVAAGGTLNTAGFGFDLTRLSGAGTLAGSGVYAFASASNQSLATILSGAGSVVKTGTGTLTLSGVNTYTGGTTVGAGTLVGNDASLPGAITNNAAVTFNEVAAGTYAGVMSGTGALTKAGAGTLTLTGANLYSGGTTISAGTLVASTATLPGNVVDNSTLVLNQTVDGTLSGVVSGTGTVNKLGAGTLTVSGASTAALNLLAGQLFLTGAGTLGNTTVSALTLLGGNGTINGNLTNNGTVSPGFSPGTIFVAGNFTQGPTGTLIMQFASPVSFDKLIITGTAALAGTLQLDTLGGFNPAGDVFTIITAGGGVAGTFTPVTGSAALAATVGYGANTVSVSFVQLPFVPVAAANGVTLTPNQTALATAAALSPALTTALDALPLASQFPDAFNAMSPQGYEIWSTIAFAHATYLADQMAEPSLATPGHDNIYFDASQAHGREGQTLDVGQSTFTTTGGLVGDDHVVGPNLTLGGFFAFGQSEADLGTPGSSTTVKDYTLGARSNWTSGPWFVHGLAAYDFDNYDGTRVIGFPGTAATANSHTHGGQWTLGVTGGQDLTVGPVVVSPFVGLLASGWHARGFTESGAGIFDNSVAHESAHSLRSQVGVEVRGDLPVASVRLQPFARVAWIHEFSDAPRTLLVSMDGVGYGITTQRSQLDSAEAAVGLNVALSPQALIYSEVALQTGSVTKILSEFRVGLSYRF